MMACDFLVVGAGIAGASVAAHLAETHAVVLIDMEERAGFHSTGRSAAVYEPNYGPAPILALTRASRYFFDHPPGGFADAPLLTPRMTLLFEAEGQSENTRHVLSFATGLQEISEAEARAHFPILREGYAKRCFRDSQTADLDVDLIHRGFLKLFKARGGRLLLSAPLKAAERTEGAWQVTCGDEKLNAATIINASGAWGDEVARLCGARPVGLQPKRRSIGVVPVNGSHAVADWPMVIDVAETWYAKPQGGSLFVSSADATPVEPHDAYADDMAVAEGIDRFTQATTLEVERISHSWGGLRTFVPDGNPVVGYDPHTEGFFWLAGQGGYGVQSSPALAETAASLARGEYVRKNVLDLGLDVADIKPERFFT
jgi:D-arginine dehydrogenase